MESLLTALIKGIAIGFTLAVPVGPIGVLCIRRTLTEGRRSALSTMLGAATADSVYGLVAAFGITLVSDFVTDHSLWFRLAGGTILIIIGVRTFDAQTSGVPLRLTFNAHVGNFASTFLLTLTNPITLVAFAAMFAGIGAVEEVSTTRTGVFLVGGVFVGSLFWFATLVTLSYIFRSFLRTQGLGFLNRITGSLIVLFGIAALFSTLT